MKTSLHGRLLAGALLAQTFLGVAAAQSMSNQHVSSAGVQANANLGGRSSISDDGRHAAFISRANNLAPGDAGSGNDVFAHDDVTGETVLVSHTPAGFASNGSEQWPWLSATGRFVVFTSDATDLVPGVAGTQVYRYDRDLDADGIFDEPGATVLVVVSVSSVGVLGNGPSMSAANSVSDDGDVVVFSSQATNLVAGDTNALADCFVRVVGAGTTTRVSVSSGGAQATGFSDRAALSGDGAVVAFQSSAPNLVAGDGNGVVDVFRHVRATAVTTRVSVSSAGVEANGGSSVEGISDDGDRIVSLSGATNLVAGDTNAASDAFVHLASSASTLRVSVGSGGTQSSYGALDTSISGDGSTISFSTQGPDVVPGDSNWQADVFVHVLASLATVRASRAASDGAQGNLGSGDARLSDDGTRVLFGSVASNLVAGDVNGFADFFVRGEPLLGPLQPPIETFCAGVACPCGNDGSGGAGCANSANAGGALLGATGTPSLAADSIVLGASGMTGSVAVFFQGASPGFPTPIDDGVGCVGAPIVRLGTKPVSGGVATFPAAGDPLVSVRGGVPPAGGVFYYQCYYRNAVAAFCPPATSNRTNGVQLLWTP